MIITKWKPPENINHCFDHFDKVAIFPTFDTVELTFINEKGNRRICPTMSTDEAEEYAKYILEAVEHQRTVQERRKRRLSRSAVGPSYKKKKKKQATEED